MNTGFCPIVKDTNDSPCFTIYAGVVHMIEENIELECVILLGLIPILEERGSPHHTQTAYQ